MLRLEEVLYGRKGFRLREEHRPHLAAIHHAASELEAARQELAGAITAAHEADVPFRAIAAAAGLSHEQARRIVRSST